MKKTLFILNDPPYGTERNYNALRLARSLLVMAGAEVKLFLIGDAVACAAAGQKVPLATTTSPTCWAPWCAMAARWACAARAWTRAACLWSVSSRACIAAAWKS